MNPFKQIKVHRWLSDLKKIIYVFNSEPDYIKEKDEIIISESIYQDDNLDDAINKIALYINNSDKTAILPIYTWVKKKSISFNINDIKWSGYNINPLNSTNRKSKELEEPIVYDYNVNELFDYRAINIIFSNDILELKNNKYYFIQKKIATYESYKKRDKKLLLLRDIDIQYIKIASEIYHRIDLQCKLKKVKVLSDIFNSLHTNNVIQMIQWVNDTSKVLYKLYKKHTISYDQLVNLTNIDKLSKIQCIYIYSVMANGTYCKVMIDNVGNVMFSYIIDIRHAINWKNIITNRNNIIKYIEGSIKQSIKLKELSLKLNVFIEIDNSNIDILSKKIGEYIDIFHVIKISKEKDKYRMSCVYKRSSNYNKESIDISEYIKSRLQIGISTNDLIVELINLGINSEEATSIIENEIEMIERDRYMKEGEKPKNNISNTGTIILIEPYREGYLINIINLPNKKELSYLLFWLTRIIAQTRDIKKKNPVILPPLPYSKKIEKDPEDEEGYKAKDEDKDEDEDEDLGLMDYDLSDGGALGKQKHSYFVTLLQQADKDLFGENYARDKCQASFQPIVMSNEYKKELEEKNLLHFDNIIEYGSKPDIKNHYACPRLWCPQSKIPLNVNDPSAKCPLENEEPMKMFWDNDKNKERYVKLIKPNEKGICVPCCFKKKPKEEELNKCVLYNPKKKEDIVSEKTNESIKVDDFQKEENYIMNQTAPITIGRYGAVPVLLHELLYPDVSFVLCSKTLNKTQKCLIRKGITHTYRVIDKTDNKKDSLLHAIAHSLNFKDKNTFVKDIKKRLDLLTFISLENGEVCKSFIDITNVIPEDNKLLCKEFKKWLELNKTTKSLLNIIDINCNDYTQSLSRLLNIYKGYNKFIEYLFSNDYPTEKSPYYLYSLLGSLYNVLLVIWEKIDKSNEINIVCPYYSSFEDILSGLDLNPNMIMLLKDRNYYEPLELKLRSTDGEKLIKLNEFPKIKKIISECSKLKKYNDKNDKIYNKIYTLHQWIKSKILKNSNKFIIDRILINSDLSIDRFLTKGNILLKINESISISLLPAFIKNLNIKNVLFYDDIVNKTFMINVLSDDLNTFGEKSKSLDISFELGKLNKGFDEKSFEFHTTLVIPFRKIKNTTIIHTNTKNILYDNYNKQHKDSKKWYQLQKMVANKLLNTYDDKTLILLKDSSIEDKIVTLFKLFSNIKDQKDKNKLQIIFEELPIESIKSIKEWINNIMIYTKYDYFDNIVKENVKEFIFSQQAILNGIPNKLLIYHKNLPNSNNDINENKIEIEDYIIDESKPTIDIMPSLYSGPPEKLKTKWIMHKKSNWINMIILKNDDYNRNTISDFYEWFSKKIGIVTSYDEIIKASRSKYYELMNNKEGMFLILEDPSYFNEWLSKIGKKYKTIQLFWDNFYSDLSDAEKNKIITKILEDNTLYPNDLNILTISELLNISILLIHRGKYGKYEDSLKRGDVDDLVLSSTFFVATKNMQNRPLIILHKLSDKHKSIYHAIIEKTDQITYNSIYLQYKDVPENIKVLVDAHMK